MPSISLSAPFCSTVLSSDSSSSFDKHSLLLNDVNGKHKVKYSPNHDWDFVAESGHKPIDCSLVLPHYRARNQPIGHRMTMFLGAESGPVRVKVCRPFPRSKFYLEVQAGYADVIVWLPSDFRGHIQHSISPPDKLALSHGFVNHIMRHVHFNDDIYRNDEEDELVVRTTGKLTLKMWDVVTGAPEKKGKEAWKRMISCSRRSPDTTINWDFLLDD